MDPQPSGSFQISERDIGLLVVVQYYHTHAAALGPGAGGNASTEQAATLHGLLQIVARAVYATNHGQHPGGNTMSFSPGKPKDLGELLERVENIEGGLEQAKALSMALMSERRGRGARPSRWGWASFARLIPPHPTSFINVK